MDEKTLVKQELYKAIAYFVERQKLVAQAMLDLGLDLDLIGQFGVLAWVSGTWNLDEETKSFLANLNKSFVGDEITEDEQALIDATKRNAERQFPQRGIWDKNDEWEYHLHGCGCHLENQKTGEPIDWDCPNVKSFKECFFREHLGWQLRTSDHKDKLKHTQMWIDKYGESSIRELMEELGSDGLIENHQIVEGLKHTLKDV